MAVMIPKEKVAEALRQHAYTKSDRAMLTKYRITPLSEKDFVGLEELLDCWGLEQTLENQFSRVSNKRKHEDEYEYDVFDEIDDDEFDDLLNEIED